MNVCIMYSNKKNCQMTETRSCLALPLTHLTGEGMKIADKQMSGFCNFPLRVRDVVLISCQLACYGKLREKK